MRVRIAPGAPYMGVIDINMHIYGGKKPENKTGYFMLVQVGAIGCNSEE
ncbi:MAG: hypothetical protein JW908_05670 [Anaerolineales bacterium]|nr:hypothetical protein [Anaerolineales bacterium]